MILRDEASIKKHIKEGAFGTLYLIYGDESYLAAHYAHTLAAAMADTSGMSFNYYAFDAESVHFDAVYEACESLPILAERVCVFIKDFPFLKTPAEELQAYTDYFSKIPSSTTLIFLVTSEEPDETPHSKWRPILDIFQKNGTVFHLRKRSERDLVQLLVRSAGKRNASLSPETAAYFLSSVGNDMTILLNEFDKLCAYADGNRITEDMIDTIATKSTEASVFDLTDAVNSRQNDRAFAVLTQLLKEKTEPTLIIGTIAFGYVDIYRAKIAEENGGSIRDYLNRFPSYKGRSFRLEKAAKSARKLTLEQIKQILEAVCEADIKIKSFSTDNAILLEELLAKLLYLTGDKKC